jgi:pimeloyl-ACP methyl ester carboxylesterase
MKSFAVRAFGVMLLLSAMALSFTRAPDVPVQALVARWGQPPSEFIDVNGQLVHLRDEGPRADATPLVLLHGTSASLHTWEGWVAALRGQRRVITLDLPGFGLTGPNAAGDYRGDTYARFVLEVMNALKVQRFHIGGNSLGGEVAWRVVTLAPERVERLVLVDAAGPAFEPLSRPIGFVLARTPVVNRLLEWVLPRPLVAASVKSVYGQPENVTPALIDRYYDLTLREGNRRALVQRSQQMANGEDADRIARITHRTLILWGGRDRLIPPAIGQQFQQSIRGSRLVVFEDLGHVPQEEDAVRTVKPVIAFLAEL